MAHQRVCIICGEALSLGRIESHPNAKTCSKHCSALHCGNLNRAAVRRFQCPQAGREERCKTDCPGPGPRQRENPSGERRRSTPGPSGSQVSPPQGTTASPSPSMGWRDD